MCGERQVQRHDKVLEDCRNRSFRVRNSYRSLPSNESRNSASDVFLSYIYAILWNVTGYHQCYGFGF